MYEKEEFNKMNSNNDQEYEPTPPWHYNNYTQWEHRYLPLYYQYSSYLYHHNMQMGGDVTMGMSDFQQQYSLNFHPPFTPNPSSANEPSIQSHHQYISTNIVPEFRPISSTDSGDRNRSIPQPLTVLSSATTSTTSLPTNYAPKYKDMKDKLSYSPEKCDEEDIKVIQVERQQFFLPCDI
jgi:hypothetical protein